MPRPVRNDHRLSMRLSASDTAIIDRAARLRGQSRTGFVRNAAVRAAEETIVDNLSIRMSPAGFRAFVEAISGPAQPVPEMVELFRRGPVWDSG